MKVNFSPDIGQQCRDLSNRDLCNPLLFVVKQMHWVGNIQLWRCFTFELSTIAWSECNGSLNCSVPISKDWISQHFVQQFHFSFLFCVIYNLVVTLLYRTYYSNIPMIARSHSPSFPWLAMLPLSKPNLDMIFFSTSHSTCTGHLWTLANTLVKTKNYFGKFWTCIYPASLPHSQVWLWVKVS